MHAASISMIAIGSASRNASRPSAFDEDMHEITNCEVLNSPRCREWPAHQRSAHGDTGSALGPRVRRQREEHGTLPSA
jgi:hypothetical protein